jgi:hypothetical protein
MSFRVEATVPNHTIITGVVYQGEVNSKEVGVISSINNVDNELADPGR